MFHVPNDLWRSTVRRSTKVLLPVAPVAEPPPVKTLTGVSGGDTSDIAEGSRERSPALSGCPGGWVAGVTIIDQSIRAALFVVRPGVASGPRGTTLGGMIFLYDRDCGFCQRSAEALVRLAPGVDVRPAGLRHHAIFRAGGEDHLGHRAIGRALASAGRNLPVRLLGRILGTPVLDPVFSTAYRLVAGQRHRLSRLVGEPACVVPGQ